MPSIAPSPHLYPPHRRRPQDRGGEGVHGVAVSARRVRRRAHYDASAFSMAFWSPSIELCERTSVAGVYPTMSSNVHESPLSAEQSAQPEVTHVPVHALQSTSQSHVCDTIE